MTSANPGRFGGRFVPETLMPALDALEQAYSAARADGHFKAELARDLSAFAGRPTPVTLAENLTRLFGGAKVFLKREDLVHTGAHKLNNTLGQARLALRMGKRRVIAETGAGQHGVATASWPRSTSSSPPPIDRCATAWPTSTRSLWRNAIPALARASKLRAVPSRASCSRRSIRRPPRRLFPASRTVDDG